MPATAIRARDRVRGEQQRGLPRLEAAVDAGETRLADHHVLEQGLDEIRLAGARRRFDRLAERAADAAEQPVDRRAVLRAAGEIHAAQQYLAGELARVEDVGANCVSASRIVANLLRKAKTLARAAVSPVRPRPLVDPFVERSISASNSSGNT